LVSDRGITSAIFNGYRGNLMKSRFPLAVLYITLPFDNVDINVHPAKNEVRFLDAKIVYTIVVNVVKGSLDQVQKNFFKEALIPETPKKQVIYEIPKQKYKETKPVEAVEESLFEYAEQPTDHIEATLAKKSFPIAPEPLIIEPVAEIKTKAFKKSEPPAVTAKAKVNYKGKFLIKGQVMSTYIIAETDDGMILVDQHAAHERIVYEKLKLANQTSVTQSQTLLMPETLELGFREADLLSEIVEELSEYGFDIEPFGGTTFIIKSVPAIIDKKETAPFILEIIDSLVDKKTSSLKNQWLDDVLILMACHSAIRANQKLNIQEMEQLLIDLEKCENPLHCPHGRPTMIKWGQKDMEKMF
ncbi:MAG: DNA mismatch repair protein MutL, partial [Desulfobacteraceae bacterium]|nr:DNA mismatch repair protein MutL [Desulfobacteraceae bacterium]